jgi:hypothetical protein
MIQPLKMERTELSLIIQQFTNRTSLSDGCCENFENEPLVSFKRKIHFSKMLFSKCIL